MSEAFLWAELTSLFLVIPFIAWLEVFRVSIFLIFAFPVAWSLVVFALLYCSEKKSGREGERPVGRKPVSVFWRIPLVIVMIAGTAWFTDRDNFLIIPRENPGLWKIILVFYPLISAAPQEFLYRVFFFRRYERILGNGAILIAVNVAAFGGLHVIYDNWLAPALTLAGGWIFAASWRAHGSFLLIWLEHSLYGLAIFTFGLGRYFYEAPGG